MSISISQFTPPPSPGHSFSLLITWVPCRCLQCDEFSAVWVFVEVRAHLPLWELKLPGTCVPSLPCCEAMITWCRLCQPHTLPLSLNQKLWTPRSCGHPEAGTVESWWWGQLQHNRVPSIGVAGGIAECSKIKIPRQRWWQRNLQDPLRGGAANLELGKRPAVGLWDSWPGSPDLLVIPWTS